MIISVEVKSNSRENSILKLGEDYYLVHVKAPAKKDKANKAVLNLLKNYFENQVYLISGRTSNKKFFEVKE